MHWQLYIPQLHEVSSEIKDSLVPYRKEIFELKHHHDAILYVLTNTNLFLTRVTRLNVEFTPGIISLLTKPTHPNGHLLLAC